jgi:hypothetical protein
MTFARVVVGFDSVSDERLAELAVRLACALRAEICGVFVEHPAAQRFARLPFAALVEQSGAMRPLDPPALARLLRVAAERAEKELSGAARRARVSASFQVARGGFVGAVREAAEARDLLVMPSARPVPTPTGPISVALGDGERARALLELAHALAPAHEPLLALLTDRSVSAGVLQRFSEERARRLLVQRVAAFEPAPLARAQRGVPARLLVVSRALGVLDETELDALRRELGCPLLIVP